MQNIITLDLEGVLIPEIWQTIAKSSQISELSLTTRDISDYNVLMQKRLSILKEHNITMHDIQALLSSINPFDGALDFLLSLRSRAEVIILSDTFIEFFDPLREKLAYPTILCNTLVVDANTGMIQKHILRMEDGKTHAVQAFQSLQCHVISSGDSYNDLGMIQASHYGVLFNPPQSIVEEYPNIPVTYSYEELETILLANLV